MSRLLLHEIQCDRCGASSDHLHGAVLRLCGSCGAIGGVDERVLVDSQAREIHRAYRHFVGPSRLEARLYAISMELVNIDPHKNPKRWRAAIKEQVALTAIVKPEHVPPDVAKSKRGFRQHLKRKVLEMELCTFDPAIRNASSGFAAIDLQASSDLHADARKWLEHAIRFAQRLQAHPDWPRMEPQTSPTAWAKQMLRTTLVSLAAFLPVGSVTSVYREVLGLELVEEQGCPRCGAAREEDCPRCIYCGAERLVIDPWLEALSARFQSTHYTSRDDFEAVAAALQLLVASHYVNQSLPSPTDARRFLEHVVPWASSAEFDRAFAIMRHGYDVPIHRFIDGLAKELESWRCEGPRPSNVSTPVEAPAPILADDPWVVAALATWRSNRVRIEQKDVAMALVSQARLPFALNHEISAAQAQEFFEQAESQLDPENLKSALSLFRAAATDSGEEAFLAELLRLQ